MPFFPSIGDEDKVPHAFAKINTGIKMTLTVKNKEHKTP